jgi:integrase
MDINEKDIEKWLNVLSQTKTQRGNLLHPTTIAHAYKLLHNMFNYGKLERILRENPCEFVHKKPSESPDEREYFTLEEMDYIKELLQTANIRLKTAIFLIMDTGCRREEIIGLKWEDVDFENNIIDINKAVVSTGKKTPISVSGAREKGVKSKHSRRRIGVPSVCIDLLKQYRNFKNDSGLRVKDTDYIFTNWDNNKVWDPNRFTAEWCTFRKEHNITKNVSLHGIRHSNATFLLSTGMPDKDVAKRLGHTLEVLGRVYTHSNEEDDKKLVAEIEKSFYGNSQKKQMQIPTASIISIIAGYVDNQYKADNYKLLDFLSSEKINSDNINNYLKPCQEYLLSIYPILDIFQNENVVPNEKVFNEKLENFVSFMGTIKPVVAPDDDLSIIHKNL